MAAGAAGQFRSALDTYVAVHGYPRRPRVRVVTNAVIQRAPRFPPLSLSPSLYYCSLLLLAYYYSFSLLKPTATDAAECWTAAA